MSKDGKEPVYLLDAGPSIAYAPSATVLLNLSALPPAPASDREPVLTVGDPSYDEPDASGDAPTDSLAALNARSRYRGTGGRLNRLPYSGAEMQWVATNFEESGVKAATLGRERATERGLRYWSPGRRVLHLACAMDLTGPELR